MPNTDNSDFDNLLMSSDDKEFDVASGELSSLEIRRSWSVNGYTYFIEKPTGRVVRDFVLHDGLRVATICSVTIIYTDGKYTPRFRFWKKDKTKAGKAVLELPLEDLPKNRMIKSAVDTDDGHENLWKLINYLQACRDLDVPRDRFRAISDDSAELVEVMKGKDKSVILGALHQLLGGNVTQADLDLIADRKGQLDIFEKLLTNEEYFNAQKARLKKKPEAVWQAFFESNPWIFGYGLTLIACESYDPEKLERATTGRSIFGGAGKRVDALLRTRGAVSSLVFCEIKRHDTNLLAPYRLPDVYRPDIELAGAVSQVQKTADKAIRDMGEYLQRHYEADGTPAGFEVATIRPRQVVVAGTTKEFETEHGLNREMVSSFEYYRRSVNDVEIITFDELLARARFIVADS
ncbi:Shedu immune nuclease family protein [Nocardia brasiliensis]|uniref:Shedu immune nuclease family protein n=1 Tax=Nocardia brasiliensis TaxID=37326 RepID=UPI003D93E96B